MEKARRGVPTFVRKIESTLADDFSEARDLSLRHGAKNQDEVLKLKALSIRVLKNGLIDAGILSELFSESKYEAWKQSRAHQDE